MNRGIRRLVRRRAGNRCEYCRLDQESAPFARFHVEHVIPKQHGGGDDIANLCFSCARCNAFKGPNLTGIDPDSGKIARLFNPRTQIWQEHFRWFGSLLIGITKIGRATIAVLNINHPQRIELRTWLPEPPEFPSD